MMNDSLLPLGISVQRLRNWRLDRRTPEGPAQVLMLISARHPRVLSENVADQR